MKYRFIILLIVLLVAVGALIVVFNRDASDVGTSRATTTPETIFTNFLPRSTKPTPISTPKQVSLATFSGTPLLVPDFTTALDTVAATDRQGTQFLSLGSVPLEEVHTYIVSQPEGVITSAERGYEILYFPDQGSFRLTILAEPIGDVRSSATRDFMTRVLITQGDLCKLLVDVTVRLSGSPFNGKHIGFAGCPRGTVLPGD